MKMNKSKFTYIVKRIEYERVYAKKMYNQLKLQTDCKFLVEMAERYKGREIGLELALHYLNEASKEMNWSK